MRLKKGIKYTIYLNKNTYPWYNNIYIKGYLPIPDTFVHASQPVEQ